MSGRLLRRRDQTPVSELGRSNPVRAGAISLLLIAIVVYFGFTKHIPFTHGFRLNAVFTNAINIRPKSPVRIAGVDVGKVSSIKRNGNVGEVSMEIEGKALPIHEDATAKIRPRLFLEGNFFVELQPGSPSAKAISSGYTIPLSQTSDPVQIDQLLDALNTDTRANLQEVLVEFGRALHESPTKAQDAIQDPEVRGLNGAQALDQATLRAYPALPGTALVNQALGGTSHTDISKLIAAAEKVTAKLDVHENELGEWVDNFNTFIHNLAAQSGHLSQAVAELPGALHSIRRALTALGSSFPSVRAFAHGIVPGIKQWPATVTASLPWIEQSIKLVGPGELGGVAKGLRGGALWTAKLLGSQATFQQQADLFSKCLTNVIYPAGNTRLQDGSSTSGVEDYKEFWYTFTGLAGNGQSFDGNGIVTHFLVGAGGHAFRSPPVGIVGTAPKGSQLISSPPLAPQGTRPAFPAEEPPYKPMVPCYTQKLPEFNGPLSQGPADGSGG
jgi:phospholipid/cholesterol/gamma-HCH transport system substrate-binding protein